jgi:4'-phosphopantetheinyl transferase
LATEIVLRNAHALKVARVANSACFTINLWDCTRLPITSHKHSLDLSFDRLCVQKMLYVFIRARVLRLQMHSLQLAVVCDAAHARAIIFSMMNPPMRFQSPEETVLLRGEDAVPAGTIDVWPLALVGTEECRKELASLLSPEERERAGRYYFERDRHAFVFARGQMRLLISRYCGVPASEVRLDAGEAGKPRLAADQALARVISFNFTHSAGRALMAIGEQREVGVDLENHDRRTDVLALADRYFLASELAAIRSAPSEMQRALFFRFWTAKEAVLKAQGIGLGAPLDSFSVELREDMAPVAVRSLDTRHIQDGWYSRTLPCESRWSAALVAQGDDWSVRIRGQ